MVVPGQPLTCLVKKVHIAVYNLLVPIVGGSYCYYSSSRSTYYCDYGYDSDESSGSIIGAVVGAILGMIFFITCIALIVCTINSKKRKKARSRRNHVNPIGTHSPSSNAFYTHTNPTYGVPMQAQYGGFQYTYGPNPSAPNLVQYGLFTVDTQPSAPPPPPSPPPPPFEYIPPSFQESSLSQ